MLDWGSTELGEVLLVLANTRVQTVALVGNSVLFEVAFCWKKLFVRNSSLLEVELFLKSSCCLACEVMADVACFEKSWGCSGCVALQAGADSSTLL